jgi:adenosylcobalamin-dependent ribonucleoside-triphosphate reductase
MSQISSNNNNNNNNNIYKPFIIKDKAPFNTVGLFTYLRTYARRKNDNDPNSLIESWEECLARVVHSTNNQLNVGFSDEEKQELFELLFNLKCSVAGRFLWQLGTRTVDNNGLLSLQNCSAIVIDEPIEPFKWAMNFLMLGAGVGFRILPEDIAKLPIVKEVTIRRKDTHDADHIVPDSREGWVGLLGKVLKAHFYSGKSFSYSCILLRSKGAPIKGFGGLASGPEILCDGMSKINDILNKRSGENIRPVDALDIMNIIGMIVVSGNVRRSALLALGDCKDEEYIRAKRWDLGNVPNYRAYSNNSVVCNNIEEVLNNEEFWQGYQGNGEPYGLINLDLMKSCGRLGETQYPDPNVACVNPCSEQTLESGESCCLAELYLPNISTKDELFLCAKYLYRICKHSLTLPCPVSKKTEEIVHRNMRMGLGVTGYLQATEEQRSWLSSCYEMLREFDIQYSNSKGFPTSIKLCTVKPSGTLSLLAGVTSGVHPGFARYYIRRIRIASDSPLILLAKKNGYPVEFVRNFDGTNNHDTMVISFPYTLPEGTILANDCTAVQQLEFAKRLQTEWSDNAISITCYYRKGELPSIKEWLRLNYNDSVKSISFLLHSDHGFDQAPLEEITEEVYNEMVKNTKSIDSTEGICFDEKDEQYIADNECIGGACPLR